MFVSYVVRVVAAGRAAGALSGRAEHVESGVAVTFSTSEELIAFLRTPLPAPKETDHVPTAD